MMGVFATVVLLIVGAGSVQATDSALTDLVKRIGDYVAGYGEKTSAIVGVEKYSQLVTLEGLEPLKPRRLVAEFAIVRAGAGWTGFRDVVEVDGRKVEERKDRLERLLMEMTGTESDLMRIANENARYNVGPISRNLNVPTAALFFFQPGSLSRFTFTRKGTKKIEGVETVELEFKEVQRPTIVMRRNGVDVPMEGSLWVVPADGTVVRTRLRLKNFADTLAMPGQQAPAVRAPVNPNVPTGGKPRETGLDNLSSRELETNADIEVTFKKVAEMGLWLPADMSEQYQGPIYGLKAPTEGRSSTRASYSAYKKFGTGAAIKKQ
jgi:hypothetical protein